MKKSQSEVKENKTKQSKITLKQLESAQNAYIVAHSDMTHKIITQDYSGRKITTKDKKEREIFVDNFRQHILSLNTLYVKFLYEQMQDLLKKSKQDALSLYCNLEGNSVTIEYNYFNAVKQEEKVTYVNSETNEVVKKFFSEMSEHFSSIIIDLSYKVLTEDGVIYVQKTDSLEDFMKDFDVELGIEYTVDINV